MALFADSLTGILEERLNAREREVQNAVHQWNTYANKVLDHLDKDFKERCTNAAKQDRSCLHYDIYSNIGAYVGCREAPCSLFSFCDWGMAARKTGVPPLPQGAWWYATQGVKYSGNKSAKVEKEKAVKYFRDRFVTRIERLGFQEVRLEGTDYVDVVWRKPTEPPAKRARTMKGNVLEECGICHEWTHMATVVPCGHIACLTCLDKARSNAGTCAFCKGRIMDTQVLFKP